MFVRERTARAIALRPHIERAFEQPKVSIDFAGFSGETLHGVMQEPLDKIRSGQLVPQSIDIRVLVPDTGQPWSIPCRVGDLADEPAFRERAGQISGRHIDAITESVAELADLGLVKAASAQVRVHGAAPMFKLYILNRAEAFFGFYPIIEHTVTLHGEPVPMYDLMGKDATIFHYDQGDDPALDRRPVRRPGASLVRQHVGHSQQRLSSMISRSLPEIIGVARHLLLDFDGPVCSIYAGTPAPVVADQLRQALQAAGISVPNGAAHQLDPLEVFRAVARVSDEAAITAQQLLTAFETRAITTARPARGSADLIITAYRTGRTVTIVSNNSGVAITAYLAAHDLAGYVRAVIGRDDHDPDLMKPSPYRVRAAVGILDAEPGECVFIGDSETDVLAGRLAGVAIIGYATKPAKVGQLTQAGADAVTTELAEISTALRATPSAALPN